jgi:probable RNA-binding protein EIF1AD
LLTGMIRPKEFVKVSAYQEDSDEDESTVGKMPPSDESDTEI